MNSWRQIGNEVLAQYKVGMRRINCPVCYGKAGDEHLTMSLSLSDDGVVHGKCWRASCAAYVRSDAFVSYDVEVPPAFVPKPLLEPYRLVGDDDYWGRQWSSRRPNLCTDGADWAGLRVLTREPTTSVWRLRGLDGVHRGHMTRTPSKTVRTFKELDRPLYYSNAACIEAGAAGFGALYLFEDAMSAALCPAPAIALLGTSISASLCDEIKAVRPCRVFVMLDPGAEEAALRVYERLVAAGLSTIFVPMERDFKDMPNPARRLLLEAYS